MAKKIIITLFISAFAAGIYIGILGYNVVLKHNVVCPNTNFRLKIKTNASFRDVMDSLTAHQVLIDSNHFKMLASFMEYERKIKAGSYTIKSSTNNLTFLRKLSSGNQTPVRFTFNSVRTLSKLAGKAGKSLELDSVLFLDLLEDDGFIDSLGFNRSSIPSLFIPNTYEFYWNTNELSFIGRMKREYEDFWNKTRAAKAVRKKLTPHEVSTLASIVEAETTVNAEKPTIAGVYLNRLRIGMPLQADPTVVYAVGDFEIKRIRAGHKAVDSPYNTYKYAGLPPGPINIPSISSIDAVLNAKKHTYIYFCAKEDFSGSHNFAASFEDHQANARRYQKALDNQGLY